MNLLMRFWGLCFLFGDSDGEDDADKESIEDENGEVRDCMERDGESEGDLKLGMDKLLELFLVFLTPISSLFAIMQSMLNCDSTS